MDGAGRGAGPQDPDETGEVGTEHERARFEQIGRNLAAVRARIERACAAAGREPGQVTLIAVTKFFPAADALALCAHGVADLSENRDQEAAAKIPEVRARIERSAALTGGQRQLIAPRWHFIGQVQTNKAKSVVSYADVVHSVDRLKLVHALDAAAAAAGRTLDCLVQVNLDPGAAGEGGPGGRGGAAPGEVERIADAVAAAPALRLCGLMAVAPLGREPAAAFERLAEVREKVRGAHPEAVSLSAGMSGDLEAAVAA